MSARATVREFLNYNLDTLIERGRTKPTRTQSILSLAVSLVAFAVYGLTTTTVVINGDGALYTDEITRGMLTARPLHLAYYVIAFPIVQLPSVSPLLTLNLLNCFFGALTVGVVFRLALTLVPRTPVALVAASLLGINYLFVVNAMFVEVYAAQTFFLLLALQLWLSEHPPAAGLAMALAMLIAPTSILALVAFVILRPQFRPLLQFGSVFGLVLLVSVVPDWQAYLLGIRQGTSLPFVFQAAANKELREIFFGIFFALPLFVGGIYYLWSDKTLRRFGLAVTSIWLLTFRFAETTNDVPAQLPTYALFCVIAAMGIQWLGSRYAPAVGGRTVFLLVASVLVLGGVQLLLGPRFAKLSTGLQAGFVILTLGYCVLVLGASRLAVRIQQAAVFGMAVLVIAGNAYYTIPITRSTLTRETSARALYLQLGQLAAPDALFVGDYDTTKRFSFYVLGDANTDRVIRSERLLGRGSTSPQQRQGTLEKWLHAATIGKQMWVFTDFDELQPLFERYGYRYQPFGKFFLAERASR